MNLSGEQLHGIIKGAVSVILVGGVVVFTVKKSEEPARMIFNWIITAAAVWFVVWQAVPLVKQDGMGAMVGLAYVLFAAMVMTAVWRHQIASLVANPFGSLYDGGSTPPDPHPVYSVAQTRQKQGRYLEAIVELRKQLDRFPTDVEGQLLVAQVQAEGLKDLPAAELTIHRFCEQPGHAPKNVVYALYSLADWHLKIGQDREAARRALEKIIELFPESEAALGAAQRIGHLGSTEMLLAPHQRKQFAVTEGAQNLGLFPDQEHSQPAEVDPAHAADLHVKHLEQHPQDTEAREKLARIYADHYGRLDLAADQLEQMIEQPNQPAKLVAHWLNVLADLQIRGGADFETVRQTLQRIIDRDPGFAAADIARNRLARLKLEMKSNAQNQSVPLGSYEQNIGLKPRAGS